MVPALMASSCKQTQKSPPMDMEQIQEDLIEMNRKKVERETAQLEEFVQEKGWDAIKTGTGLYVYIYEQSDTTGALSMDGQVANIDYTVKLLDGTLCYSTEAEGPESFLIGQDNVESGLHEGIKYLHVGDKAKILMPSHLAHGFTGDQNRIPQNAAIIYDIHLLDLR